GNRITFKDAQGLSIPHGLSTGQLVTYQRLGGGSFGLSDGRRYGVIVPVIGGVPSSNSLQLGTSFAGAAVDQTRDPISFGGPPGLLEGDMVWYFASPTGGFVPGLSSGTLFSVHVVAGRTIKLVLPTHSCG